MTPPTAHTLLQEAPIARREAEALLTASWGLPLASLLAHPERQPPASVVSRFKTWCDARHKGMPIAYLVGEKEFFGLPLKVNEATLIPRPETELLVELALTHTPPKGSLLDLGCGSGAIAIAIKRQRPDINVHALDTSTVALSLAQTNATHHHCTITWQQGHWWNADWSANIPAFDVVVSNPPYVASDDPHLQQGDCRFEPRLALDGGSDGLDALRTIIKGAHRGRCRHLFLEHGYNQAASVRQLLSAQGFSSISSWRDLAGIERVSSARWPD